jgi:hypothetical protein
VFLEAEGELAESPMWCSLRPLSQGGLMGGTAKLSKQLFGLERSVLDPVQVSVLYPVPCLVWTLFGVERSVLDPVQVSGRWFHISRLPRARLFTLSCAAVRTGSTQLMCNPAFYSLDPLRLIIYLLIQQGQSRRMHPRIDKPHTHTPYALHVQAAKPTKTSADLLRAMKEKAQSMQQSAQVAGAPALPQGELEMRRAREEMEIHTEHLLAASRAVRAASGDGVIGNGHRHRKYFRTLNPKP